MKYTNILMISFSILVSFSLGNPIALKAMNCEGEEDDDSFQETVWSRSSYQAPKLGSHSQQSCQHYEEEEKENVDSYASDNRPLSLEEEKIEKEAIEEEINMMLSFYRKKNSSYSGPLIPKHLLESPFQSARKRKRPPSPRKEKPSHPKKEENVEERCFQELRSSLLFESQLEEVRAKIGNHRPLHLLFRWRDDKIVTHFQHQAWILFESRNCYEHQGRPYLQADCNNLEILKCVAKAFPSCFTSIECEDEGLKKIKWKAAHIEVLASMLQPDGKFVFSLPNAFSFVPTSVEEHLSEDGSIQAILEKLNPLPGEDQLPSTVIKLPRNFYYLLDIEETDPGNIEEEKKLNQLRDAAISHNDNDLFKKAKSYGLSGAPLHHILKNQTSFGDYVKTHLKTRKRDELVKIFFEEKILPHILSIFERYFSSVERFPQKLEQNMDIKIVAALPKKTEFD